MIIISRFSTNPSPSPYNSIAMMYFIRSIRHNYEQYIILPINKPLTSPYNINRRDVLYYAPPLCGGVAVANFQ